MSCSCNASALRLFARGLVQVHRLEPGIQFALPVRSAFAGAWASQRRSLHASRALRDAETPAPATPPPEKQPASAEDRQPRITRPPTEPASQNPPDETNPDEDGMTEARGKAAWRFKRQGFDWKAFRSNDPATRSTVDFSNFDWKHWQGKKHGNQQLGKLVDNLEAARAQDRAAVGISPRDGDAFQSPNHRWRKAPLPPTNHGRYDDATEDGASPPPRREEWMIQKEAMKAKFPEGWKPHKRLSPDALAGIRALNAQFPDVYTTKTLADKFAVSPEAIRRILKSRWAPSSQEEEDRQQRWHRRGVDVWARKAELGIKPPKRWRDEGVAREPAYHDRKAEARRDRAERVNQERDEYMRSFTKGRGGGEDERSAGSPESRGGDGQDRRRGDGEDRPATQRPWMGRGRVEGRR
ncbi:mitochondrion organization and biogenesis [Cordyceps militaris]|uniref:Required for respiratory growth protein 9, mitochondrial n=1 Tax=Cordyceps militaris TaxID=73501 RepID=A0A2H4SM51_CORMI|nr:mitochondrion organization and biogenesis [Cordyceps militaris]